MASTRIKYLIVLEVFVFVSMASSQTNPLSCQPVEVPMCKGLVDYTLTRLPNRFGHTTQSDVYWALQQWWPFMDMGCSRNLRILLCGLYLPKCTEGQRGVELPCRQACKRAKSRCSAEMQRQNLPWPNTLRCTQFLPTRSNSCIKPVSDKKKKKKKKQGRGQVSSCQRNRLPMCSDIPYRYGSLPNMFQQFDYKEMKTEMAQYQDLIDSNCSPDLKFFLCGAFMPFCIKRGTGQCDIPFVVPCREVCERVQRRCGSIFTEQRAGLPWPGKLHCHRYPSKDDVSSRHECHVSCVLPPGWQDE